MWKKHGKNDYNPCSKRVNIKLKLVGSCCCLVFADEQTRQWKIHHFWDKKSMPFPAQKKNSICKGFHGIS